jgi:PAS domain S-box-containing protein
VLCSIDADGLVTALGQGGGTVLGWSPEEFGRRPLAALVHPLDRLGAEHTWCLGAREGARLETESRFRRKDGTYRWLHWTCLHADGSWYCGGKDVSEQKAAEATLAVTEQRARAVVTALRDGVITLDLEGRVIDVTDRYCEITGFSREEILAWAPPFPTWPDEHRASYLRSFAHERMAQSADREVEYQRKDRSRFPAILTVSPLRDANGEPTGSIGVLRDLSEQRRLDAVRADEQRAVAKSETRLREAQVTAQIGNWSWSAGDDRLRPSLSLLEVAGLPADATLSTDEYHALVHEDDRERARTLWSEAITERKPFATEYRLCLPNLPTFWLDVRGRPELDDTGAFTGFFGTAQNITERKQSGEDARFQASLLEQVEAAVIATDLEGIVTHWNAAAERLYGWTAKEAVGARAGDLVVPAGEEAPARIARDALARNGRWHGEFQVHRKDGSTFPVLVTNSVIRDGQKRPVGLVGVSVDITARKLDHEHLGEAERFLAAVTDNMAEGLFSLDGEGRVTHMNAVAERLLGWRQAELQGRSMDDYIHHTRADGSPRPAGESLLAATSHGGSAARVEEDVFAHRDGTLLPVTYTASPLFTAGGVNGAVVVFSDISARQAERLGLLREIDELSWVGRIQDALLDEKFVLFAQPIIDLADGRTVSHELLIRMLHDDKIVPPCEFLPTAEKHGLIKEIDRWVIGEATRIAATGAMVQVNVSAMSFGDLELPERFDETLRASGADPANVVVEITETTLMQADTAEDIARRLTDLGLQLSLDDFGTGYGGFTYLKRLPVSQLKVDREFVRDLTVDPASRHVVEAVVALAHGFGQKTVAEGVEDQPTLDLLKELGVDYAQGFHIGRPAPVGEVVLTTTEEHMAHGR